MGPIDHFQSDDSVLASWLNQIESDERNPFRDSLLQSLDQGV
jgi:hypothetical protein